MIWHKKSIEKKEGEVIMKKILSLVAVLAMVVTLVSVAAFSASAASTKVYKFTFEDENATSILKKGGVYVGEVV
ncbi:MAG: hypothetical protein MJ083_05790, partial [Clostridia bacterium]|nr:hypothetical protein [Clostridia bacterium]